MAPQLTAHIEAVLNLKLFFMASSMASLMASLVESVMQAKFVQPPAVG